MTIGLLACIVRDVPAKSPSACRDSARTLALVINTLIEPNASFVHLRYAREEGTGVLRFAFWSRSFMALSYTAAVIALPVCARAVPSPLEDASIVGSSFGMAIGAIGVNQSVGNGNVQANVAVIDLGGSAHVQLMQQHVAPGSADGGSAVIDNAFTHAIGVIQINQSAGSDNAQSNVTILGDGSLSATVPINTPGAITSSNGYHDVVRTTGSAFSNAKGIVQVNQTAGAGNSSANSLSLQLPSVAGH